eukprot:TRINITY_DN1144_c0_g1_i1.p1 TRINITY_DN1144_c0_g1~~TRINITY_DN1144_c0_g1_i1.p1  ORF type:complete len:408 (+),score=30.76 TRINITY_DN1144_c0_g1_i1:106-1224(+)
MSNNNNRIVPIDVEERKLPVVLSLPLRVHSGEGHSNPVRIPTDDNEKAEEKKETAVERETGLRTIDITTDDPLGQDISGYRRKLEVTSDQLANLAGADEPPKLKTVSLALEGFEKIGDEWVMIEKLNQLCKLNYKLWLVMSRRVPKLLYLFWSMLCLLGYVAFYILFLIANLNDRKSVEFVINAILLSLDVIYIRCLAAEIYYAYQNQECSDCFMTFYAWVQCMYSGLSIFIGVSMLFEGDPIVGLIFGLAVYVTALVQSLNATFWIICIPLVIVGFFVEFVIRSMVCKLSCPYIRPKVRVYTFAIYKFGQPQVKDAKQCTICLGDYADDDENMVVLLCGTKHVFHEKCLFEWIKKQEYCPVCRGEIKFSVS